MTEIPSRNADLPNLSPEIKSSCASSFTSKAKRPLYTSHSILVKKSAFSRTEYINKNSSSGSRIYTDTHITQKKRVWFPDEQKQYSAYDEKCVDRPLTEKDHYQQQQQYLLSEVVCEVESCFNYPSDVREALYYSRKEYQFSKSSARVVAKEAERYGNSRQLDRTYCVSSYLSSRDCFHQKEDVIHSSDRKYTSSDIVDNGCEVQNALNLWCLHGHSRRGLERWCNIAHGNERKEDQYMYMHSILKAQAQMKLKGMAVMKTHTACSTTEPATKSIEEHLRDIGCQLSKKARVFAERMGAADRDAAKWEFGIREPSQNTKNKHLGLLTSRHRLPVGRLNLGLSSSPSMSRSSKNSSRTIVVPRSRSSSGSPNLSSTRRRRVSAPLNLQSSSNGRSRIEESDSGSCKNGLETTKLYVEATIPSSPNKGLDTEEPKALTTTSVPTPRLQSLSTTSAAATAATAADGTTTALDVVLDTTNISSGTTVPTTTIITRNNNRNYRSKIRSTNVGRVPRIA